MDEQMITITKREYDELCERRYTNHMLSNALRFFAKLGWDGDSIRADDDLYNVFIKATLPDFYNVIFSDLKRQDEEEKAAKAEAKKDGDAE